MKPLNSILKTIGFGSVLWLTGCNATPTQPNVIVIFMDDLGYGDINTNGAIGYSTPNLNRMAAQGIQFKDFYVAQPVSSASRAGLLTGCYSNRVGFHHALMPWDTTGLNTEETTIAELFKQKEYQTAIIGKWHLGRYEEFLPLQHGFDYYFGLPYSNDQWAKKNDGYTDAEPGDWYYNCRDLMLIENNTPVEQIKDMDDQSQLTTRYTQKAVEYIEENSNKPFFLYLTHPMPHIPISVSDKFKGKSNRGIFGDVMMEVDWSVGEIFSALERAGIDDNTLVIFTSDNGAWIPFGEHAGSNGGLREGKSTSFEGGQRVPCLMWWKGVIPEAQVCTQIASTIDLLPTFADMIGAELPENKIDGVNILPLIKGEVTQSPRKEFVYYFGEGLRGIRNERWKLVLPQTYPQYYNGGNDGFPHYGKQTKIEEVELYDLWNDQAERCNVAEYHPEVVEEMLQRVEYYREDLGDAFTNTKGKNRREIGRTTNK